MSMDELRTLLTKNEPSRRENWRVVLKKLGGYAQRQPFQIRHHPLWGLAEELLHEREMHAPHPNA